MRPANLALCGLVLVAAACGRQEPAPAPSPSPTDTAAPWFREITADAGIDFQHRSGLEGGFFIQEHIGSGGALFDYDGDGDLDLFLVDSAADDRLYRHETGGRFVDRTAAAGLGDAGYGMGSAVGDVDGDGDLDRETNTLYVNLGAGFQDATAAWDVGRDSLPYTGFGTAFFDAENDGDLDLLVADGRVRRGPAREEAELAAGVPDYWREYAEPNLFFVQEGGRFHNRSDLAGELTRRVEVSRSLMLGDLDLDGGLDVLLTQSNGPARLFRNEAPRRGRWLVLRAFDPELGRDAVGARVDVEAGGAARRGVVTSTCSYLAAVEPFVHFGLGNAAGVDRVTVHWPDGVRQRLLGLPADRRVVVYKPRSPAP